MKIHVSPFKKYYLLTSFSFFILLATRRWNQLVMPQVWSEDGSIILPGFLEKGWLALFDPVAGYFIIVPKFISMLSLEISFSHYPLISTLLSWGFIVFVGLAITYSPTKIKGKFICATSVFLIPTDPEVFGLPLYTLWWSALLVFLVTLWDERISSLHRRLCFLIIGGLSSPAIIVSLPLFYLRAYLYKGLRSEKVIALVATLITLAQVLALSNASNQNFPAFSSLVQSTIPKFLGHFLIASENPTYLWVSGLVVLASVIVLLIQNRSDLSYWILAYLLAASIALTVIRINPELIHPKIAGPRYFFFPYIFIFWYFIHSFFKSSKIVWVSFLIIPFIVLPIINAKTVWSRQYHDDLDWNSHIYSCRLFPEYNIPIHVSGSRYETWFLKMSGENCMEYLDRDPLAQKGLDSVPTFPYTIKKWDKYDNSRKPRKECETDNTILNNTMLGSDNPRSEFKNYRVIGSFDTSDADTGRISLKLQKDDCIYYHSGLGLDGQLITIEGENGFISDAPSAINWVELSFSNKKLPPQFTITIEDKGTGWEEWSAIAIRK